MPPDLHSPAFGFPSVALIPVTCAGARVRLVAGLMVACAVNVSLF